MLSPNLKGDGFLSKLAMVCANIPMADSFGDLMSWFSTHLTQILTTAQPFRTTPTVMTGSDTPEDTS